MIGWLQAGLRAVFMRVEALFNRAFGDRLNPLYHLGAIAFFLFWIVAATGLYLYAFFDTGVALITDAPVDGVPSIDTKEGLAKCWG